MTAVQLCDLVAPADQLRQSSTIKEIVALTAQPLTLFLVLTALVVFYIYPSPYQLYLSNSDLENRRQQKNFKTRKMLF